MIETPKTTLTPSQEIVFAAALYLILERDKKITRESLERMLWPKLQQADRAHHRLRQTLLKLRQAGIPVVRDKGFLRIGPTTDSDFDAILSTSKENHLPTLPTSFQVLPDYSPRFSIAFAHWIDEKRSEINSALIRILLEHIRHSRNRAEWARVEQLARTCLDIDPFNEEAVLARAEAVALRGGKVEALALLDEYIRDLGGTTAEIGLPPNVMRKRISERRLPDSYKTESEFVGRGKTMELLSMLFDRARAGFGQAILISGAAGIGKSRVLMELGRFAELQGARVERLRSQPTDKERPLSAFIDLTPNLLQMRGAIGCNEETIIRLRGLNTNDHRPQSGPDSESESELVYPRIRAALFDLLDAVCEEQTLLICLDDIQWLDVVSARLLNEISLWCRTHRLLLVTSSRDSESALQARHTWPDIQRLVLHNLDLSTSHLLFEKLIGSTSNQPSDIFGQKSLAVADGNPFFLQEIVRQWVETGDENNLPESLEIIVRERISRLSEHAIQTLQTCAMLGKYSTIERIECVLEYKSYELLTALDELGTSSMIVIEPDTEGSSTRYSCRHDLLAAAAIDRLHQSAKAFLHRRIGLVLECEAKEGSTSLLWECANHWHLAGDSARALELALSCARHMIQIGLYSEAGKMFGKATALTDVDEVCFDISVERLKAFQLAGDWQAAFEVASDLATWSGECPESVHNQFELMMFDARWKLTTNWRTLLDDLLPCVFSSQASVEHRLEAGIMGLKIAGNLVLVSKFNEIFREIEPLLCDDSIDAVMRLEALMIVHTDVGNLELACEAAEEYLAKTKLSNSPLGLVKGVRNAAHVFRRAGKIQRVEEILSEAYAIAIQEKLMRRAALIAVSFVKTMLESGDLEKARFWYERSDETLLIDDLHSLAEHHLHGARLALSRNDLDGALSLFGDNFGLIESDQNLLRRISALAMLVIVKTAQRQPATALCEALRELETEHLIVRGTGGQDFETAALVSGLVYVGQGSKAKGILGEYLSKWRRDSGPRCLELMAASNLVDLIPGTFVDPPTNLAYSHSTAANKRRANRAPIQ